MSLPVALRLRSSKCSNRTAGGCVAHPTTICRVVRRLRGGSQSHLVQCEDGHHYAAKFLGNPQGTRTLINEFLTHHFLSHLGVVTPKVALLHLPAFMRQSGAVFFQAGDKRILPQEGLHFGSRYPVDPEKKFIFDVMPEAWLDRIANLNDYATVFVVDRLMYHCDKRQAVFVRDRKVNHKIAFAAYFIDHGHTLGGTEWRLRDEPLHGLALPRSIYSHIDIRALAAEAVETVQSVPESILQAAYDSLPSAWFESGDRQSLVTLLNELEQRKARLQRIVSRHLDVVSPLVKTGDIRDKNRSEE